ncbi:MAG: glycerophosphodiester phosphodiesterase family protein [Bauldia sp.]
MSRLDWLTARPIAHRGYHDRASGRIENTLAAAAAAVERGFAIECDLQITADGEVVVFHDDTLDRLTESTGRIDRTSLVDIRKARFRDGDARVPTLEDLLDLVDGRVPLVIELKSRWNGDRRLEQVVAGILAAYSGPMAVMSFDPASMVAMRRLAPELARGMTADHFPAGDWPMLSWPVRFASRNLLSAPFVLPSFVAYGVKALPASAPLALRHFFRRPLLTRTVRTAADLVVARRWADQIIFEGFDPDAA